MSRDGFALIFRYVLRVMYVILGSFLHGAFFRLSEGYILKWQDDAGMSQCGDYLSLLVGLAETEYCSGMSVYAGWSSQYVLHVILTY